MNSEEGVSLAKMAVTVLLVVLVIGAVVAIVQKAYSWFNSGSDKLGDQVTSIGSSAYSQYDDVMVKGTDVLSALKSYRDAEFGVVIVNLQNMNGTAYTPSTPNANCSGHSYCGTIKGTKADDQFSVKVASSGEPTDCTVAYNDKEGKYFCTNLAFDPSGLVVRNTNFSVTTDSSQPGCFIKQTGSFYSKLIYSKDTGDVCGIIFLQVA